MAGTELPLEPVGSSMTPRWREMDSNLRFLVARPSGARKADNVNGYRFEANLLDVSLPPAETARCAGLRAGFEMHPQS